MAKKRKKGGRKSAAAKTTAKIYKIYPVLLRGNNKGKQVFAAIGVGLAKNQKVVVTPKGGADCLQGKIYDVQTYKGVPYALVGLKWKKNCGGGGGTVNYSGPPPESEVEIVVDNGTPTTNNLPATGEEPPP